MAISAAPEQNTSRRERARLVRELIIGNNSVFNSLRLQSTYVWDDVVQDLGINIYKKMMQDAQVSSCVALFKASIIEDGLMFAPAITDKEEDGYNKAQEIATQCQMMFCHMETSIDDVLWDMLECLVIGSRVAEITYELNNGRLDIKYIKPKPFDSVQYIIDEYNNVVGISGNTVKNNGLLMPPTFPANPDDVLPRDKFLIFTFRQRDNDPRGTSLIRPAYDAWWRKRQTIPEQMKYLSQFGSPSIVANLPENVEKPDESDDDTIDESPEQTLLNTLLAFKNSSVVVVPAGTTIEFLKSEGDGQAFRSAITDCNMEITKAILNQELATEQSRFQARAAAQVHQGIFDTVVRQAKRSFVWAFMRDVIRPWVSYNWGDKASKELCPTVTLGTTEQSNLAPLMTAISALERAGYIAAEQRPEIDKMLGLPVRSSTDEPQPEKPVVQPNSVDNNSNSGNSGNNSSDPANNNPPADNPPADN